MSDDPTVAGLDDAPDPDASMTAADWLRACAGWLRAKKFDLADPEKLEAAADELDRRRRPRSTKGDRSTETDSLADAARKVESSRWVVALHAEAAKFDAEALEVAIDLGDECAENRDDYDAVDQLRGRARSLRDLAAAIAAGPAARRRRG